MLRRRAACSSCGARNPSAGLRVVQKQLGSSLLETFGTEQLAQHGRSMREDMEKVPVPKSAATQLLAESERCGICEAKHNLAFEPPPKNCCACGQRIKKNQFYYFHQMPPACWCNGCYTAAGEELYIENVAIKKATLANAKRKNAEVEHEPWVACDHCDRWVHMVCGLFNKGNNRSDTTFLCPWCLTDLQQRGEWQPTEQRPQSMLGAEELPTTQLSDAIEAQARARAFDF